MLSRRALLPLAGPRLAGDDQTAPIGQQFTLDGSASSDADGTIQTYFWVQISGTRVQMVSQDQPELTLTAPDSLDTLAFVLHVIDDGFARDIDTVRVIIIEEQIVGTKTGTNLIVKDFFLAFHQSLYSFNYSRLKPSNTRLSLGLLSIIIWHEFNTLIWA